MATPQLPPYPAQATPGDYIWVDWWRRLQQYMKEVLEDFDRQLKDLTNKVDFSDMTPCALELWDEVLPITEIPMTSGYWVATQGVIYFQFAVEVDSLSWPFDAGRRVTTNFGPGTNQDGNLVALPPPVGWLSSSAQILVSKSVPGLTTPVGDVVWETPIVMRLPGAPSKMDFVTTPPTSYPGPTPGVLVIKGSYLIDA